MKKYINIHTKYTVTEFIADYFGNKTWEKGNFKN